jgi:organic hydroperoxide reductase OsmC/OhrA
MERVTQFTRFDMAARLVLTRGEDADSARHLLEKAERDCLISRSLKGAIDLKVIIEVDEPAHLEAVAS